MLGKIFAVIKIIRPVNILIIFFTVIVGGIICSDTGSINSRVILSAIAFSFLGASANVVNDIFDLETDKINKPLRVLPAGMLSINQAWYLFSLLSCFSIVISLSIGILPFIIICLSEALVFLYSSRLKRIPLVGNIVVSLMTALAFLFGGIVVGNIKAGIIPAVFAFLINFIRELIKDIEDVEGDGRNNIKTIPIIFGEIFTIRIIVISTILLIFFTFIPFIAGYYKIEYFIIVMVTVNVLFVYFIKQLSNGLNREKLSRLSWILKVNMVFGLWAIYSGK